MKTFKHYLNLIVFVSMIITNLVGPLPGIAAVRAQSSASADAVVLVNSASGRVSDFTHFIQPYLDQYGVPYQVLDIATSAVVDLDSYALIIIGHRDLDDGSTAYLDASEQDSISAAVAAGTGLVNFDNNLSADQATGRFAFINTIFNFGYTSNTTADGVSFDTGSGHYITQKHTAGETIGTEELTLAGISLPAGVTRLVSSGTQPLLAVTTFTSGRAVQWGSYDWMSHAVLGPLMGMDDLVWRSIVWAARKPFVMQGMPPFVTIRMDDTIGPLDWVHISNEVGFKPWLGVFTDEIDPAEAADLKSLADSGNATVGIHAFATGTSHFFYFDHNNGQNYSDTEIAANFTAGSAWFNTTGIPISKYVVPHYYEVGSNALDGLANWGVEFVSTVMDPGQLESSAPWMKAGPYRKYEDGSSYDRNHNIYYADTFPTDSRFFNCITEFRDADPTTHYEWDPKPSDIAGSITYGTKWLTDGLDNMVLSTLFSHEYMLYDVSNTEMRTIMQGIAANLTSYNPIYVTMDYGCQYARAIKDSAITASEYDSETNTITVHFSGTNDMATKFYVFNAQGSEIQQTLVDAPQLNGSGQVIFTLPGELDHVTVTPNPASVIAGATQQFSAAGYDALENVIPNLPFTWSVSGGAGTITSAGLFTAATATGSYPNAVTASFGGVSGSANVQVMDTTIDHFSFDPISTPQYSGVAFPVTIRARDVSNNLVVSYTGTAALSDTTGTITPTTTGAFTLGSWTGTVTLAQTNASVTLQAADGAVTGTSAAFALNTLRDCPCSIWEGTGTPVNPSVSDNRPIEVGVKFRADIPGYVMGVQFYKGTSNTGTHTGHLWSTDGALLAEATFEGETASGWQKVIFNPPVAIAANTTYVASYYSPGGYFADSPDTLHSGVDNAPVHALAEGVDGANGVYRYDSTGYPSATWVGHAPNYWVDVIFDTVTEHSIFDGTGTPQSPAAIDVGHSIEVGAKFRSSMDGQIRALRYYKGTGVTGVHVGHLWSSTGTLLATVEFTNESAQGWQEARLTSPVAITANTVYIVSYYSPEGYFAYTPGYFGATVTRAPLTALANSPEEPNGVYNYDSSAFPAASGNGSNYWVDVVFALSAVPDTTLPLVSSVLPSNNATGVGVNNNVTALFSESIAPATVNSTNFFLKDAANNTISAVVSYTAASRTATLNPDAALAYNTVYTATVKGGSGGIADLSGNTLAADATWSFTTASEPPAPPNEGPGGPILVIGSTGNPFGRYYAEILRNEGFNEFYATDITSVNATLLNSYDVVILGEMSLTANQVTLLTDWVTAGGNLVAMRPDKQLANLLGLADAGGALANAYLLINTTSGPGVGLTDQTIQFHSGADLYTPISGVDVLATLYSTATTATSNPAVTLVSVGSNGGQAAAFTYDLARSVVYTRQGNPAWAEQERDTAYDPQNLIRSSDKFFGNLASDPQPDWIDFSKIQIPQADEQQRLLANLIQRMNADKKPLPHFWYFPRGEKAVIIMTGDDHGSSGTVSQWEHFKSVSPAGCSVDDWECVRGSSYMYTNNGMTNEQAAAYSAQGFEVALHFDTGCSNFTRSQYETVFPSQLAAFLTHFPGIAQPDTQRTHCISFSDWDSQPIVSSAMNIRLDTNYYYWPPAWTQDRPGLFTGSGMIMRFAQLDGTIIDSYQAVTQMTDESGMTYPRTAEVLMDNAIGPLGYYGAFTTNMHTDHATHTSGFAVVDAALARGVPVVSGRQMLTWLDGRNASSFTNLAWNGDHLTFGISVGSGANGLRAMLPMTSGAAELVNITRDGNPVTYTTETIKGISYAIFPATAGSYSAAFGIDDIGPVISATTVTTDASNGATVAWTTDEASTSRVDYGTDSASLSLNASASSLVTGHSLYLSGLTPNTTYYYRVTSADEGGYATTSPAVEQAPLSFITPAAVLVDSTAANFNSGTPGTCSVVQAGNGEVILTPAISAEFNDASLPSGWTPTLWSGGSQPVVSGGNLTLSGAMIASTTAYSAGVSVEFVATFHSDTASTNEHIGLTNDNFEAPWTIFSNGGTGSGLKARTNSGSTPEETNLGTSYFDTPHRYRIDWLSTGISYYIDGNLVATHTALASSVRMRPTASDWTATTTNLTVDWMRISPYATPCTFTSRVLDAGEVVTWDNLAWTGATPAGAALAFSIRFGNNPDLSSQTWIAISGASPAALSGSSRFIQYQAVLSTTETIHTPVLEDVTLSSHAGTDTEPPTIQARSPAAGANNVAVGANVTVTFSELMTEADFSGATFRLRADGAGSDETAVVSYTGATATLNPDADLAYSTFYHVTVAGTVTDLAGNALGSDATWSFTTAAVPVPTLADSTAEDFNAAAANTCVVDSTIGDGAVRLPLSFEDEFSGTALSTVWEPVTWAGGSAPTVGGGLLSLNGGQAYSDATFGPGRVLEFRATFTAHAYEGIGLAGGEPPQNALPWVMFGTGNSGTQLYARIMPVTGGSYYSGDDAIPLGTAYFGSPHTYRIEWTATGVTYFIDGTQVASSTTALAANLHISASDFTNDGDAVTVDWIRLSPYVSPCTYASRVLDAGDAVNWGQIAWTSTLPAATVLNLSYRTGSTSTLDGAEWVSIAGDSPQSLSGHSRYIQYRATLSTTDISLTPSLNDVSITYLAGADTTPPVISDLSGSAVDSASALITWNTNEPANSLVMYGTAPATLTAQASAASLVTSHSIVLTGLTPETTYYYRVVSADEAANSVTAPASGQSPASFSTPVLLLSLTDGTSADFNAGTAGSCVVDATMGDGVVRLPGTIEENFDGSALPSGWTGFNWETAGTLSVGGGMVSVNGSSFQTDAYYGPGVSLEAIATFRAEQFQHLGFGGTEKAFNAAPIAMFSTRARTDTLYTSLYLADTYYDVAIPNSGSLIGSPHRYRIDWKTDGFDFYVDGSIVSNRTNVVTQQMHVGGSDYPNNAVTLSVDSIFLKPYLSPCTFTARVLDAGATADWRVLSWTGSSPAGTGVAVETRSGDTAAPDGAWSEWAAVMSGSIASPNSRYLQYRAALTGNTDTPNLDQVTVSYSQITNQAPLATPQTLSTDEDTPLAVTLTGIDPDGNPLSFAVVTAPQYGALSGTAPNLTYTPALNDTRADSFTFTVSDGSFTSAPALIAITINPINDAPVAFPDGYSTNQDMTLSAPVPGVLENDTDVEGSSLTAVVDSLPAHGTLTLNANGSFTYVPVAGWTGVDGFTYHASDGSASSTPVAVTLNVNGETPPLPSSFYGYIRIYDNPPHEGDLVEAYKPGDTGAVATAAVTSIGSYTMVVPAGAKGSASQGDRISFRINGRVIGTGTWRAGTNVHLDFHPPQALPGSPGSGSNGVAVHFNGSVNDYGADAITYEWDWENDGAFDASGASVSYTWATVGSYTAALQVTDAQGGVGSTTFPVEITNAAPVLGAVDNQSVNELAPLSFTASAVDFDPVTYSLTGAPEGATIQSTTGVFTWTPAEAQGPGSYTFTVRACDASLCDSQEITVTVNEVNIPPVLGDIGAQSVVEMSLLTFTAHATDGDEPANPLTFSLVDAPTGAEIGSTTGVFTWTPTNAQGPAEYTFAVQVCDGQDCDAETITISVTSAFVTHRIALVAGWNLVSFNVHPVSTLATDVLASLGANYDLVYAWDASGENASSGNWLKLDDVAGYNDSLTILDESMGFWIHMKAADTLEVTGTMVETSQIAFYDNAGGWNLIGYPSAGGGALPAILDSHNASAVSFVYAYNASDTADPWKLFDKNADSFANDLTALSPGLGYWMRVNSDGTWSVSY